MKIYWPYAASILSLAVTMFCYGRASAMQEDWRIWFVAGLLGFITSGSLPTRELIMRKTKAPEG